jgi:hypothetical protein
VDRDCRSPQAADVLSLWLGKSHERAKPNTNLANPAAYDTKSNNAYSIQRINLARVLLLRTGSCDYRLWPVPMLDAETLMCTSGGSQKGTLCEIL